jgi:hypothetical protein
MERNIILLLIAMLEKGYDDMMMDELKLAVQKKLLDNMTDMDGYPDSLSS